MAGRKENIDLKMNREMEELKRQYNEPQMSKGQLDLLKNAIENAKQEKDRNVTSIWVKYGVGLAAAVAVFIILPNTSAQVAHAMEQIPLLGKLVKVVTFRDYQYEDEKNEAHINVPEITLDDVTNADRDKRENLQQTIDEINAEVQKMAEAYVERFESNLKENDSYQNIGVNYEIINTTADYFTLKLECYQVYGTATVWNYYYTIDLNTGKQVTLGELFEDGADYITPISENIKTQMLEQMESDESKVYWLDYEIDAWNFKQISADTEFYINADGNIVISFHEGDVAPMYMGVVTFEIPAEVVAGIRK